MRLVATMGLMAAMVVSCGAPASHDSGEEPIAESSEPPVVAQSQRWIEQLGDDDPTVRDKACAALLGSAEDLSDAELASISIAVLDRDAERAARAANLRREIGLLRALGPVLLQDLRDFEAGRMESDGTARPLLGKAAGRWGGGGVDDGQVEALVEIVLRNRWEHGLEPRFMEEHRVRPFARFFEDLPDSERIVMLGWSGNRRYVPEIIGLLRSEVPQVQQAAARALGRIGDASVAPELVRLLDSNVPVVREASLWALAELRSDIADEKIEALLADAEPDVRRAAAYAVVRLRKVNAIVALAKAWERADRGWRHEFLSYLVHMCDERLHMAYRKELLRNDAGTRLMVAEAFIQTTRPWHAQEVADLISSGIETALEVAPEAAARLDPAEALALLAPLLKDPRHEVREAAVDALGEVESAAVDDLLTQAMRDPDVEVRRSALWALGRRTRDWANIGLEALKDPQLEVTGLRFVGRHGVIKYLDRIIERLRHEEGAVRQAAIEALRDLDARDALPAIQRLTTDPVQAVREEAIFTAILWGADSDPGFLRVQAETGKHRDRELAAAELLFRGDARYMERIRERVVRSGRFGEDYWDARLSLLEPLLADSCLRSLDDSRNPNLRFLGLAGVSETAALFWGEPERHLLLERLRRLSDHPDVKTRLCARFSRFYLEETTAAVQLEVLGEIRCLPESSSYLRELFLRSLAFANAREAFRDLGRPIRLEREVCGDAGFAAHLRERGYEIDPGSAAFVGRRGPGSWLTALASLRRYRQSLAIEGKKIRFLGLEDPMEYWSERLRR